MMQAPGDTQRHTLLDFKLFFLSKTEFKPSFKRWALGNGKKWKRWLALLHSKQENFFSSLDYF
jgi:hypothetical protein